MVREWGGFYRKAINFSAAVRPASTVRFLRLVMLTSDRSISKRTGIVTGMVADTISESLAATLVQNCETGGQFHIICKKVPEAFIEHRLHKGSVINFIQWSLRGVSYVLCTLLKWIWSPNSGNHTSIFYQVVVHYRRPLERNDKVQILYLSF